jgi:hypothetical protein
LCGKTFNNDRAYISLQLSRDGHWKYFTWLLPWLVCSPSQTSNKKEFSAGLFTSSIGYHSFGLFGSPGVNEKGSLNPLEKN